MDLSAGSGDMCICVNCRWVDRCKAYHAVERQHGVPHLNATPDFEPIDPFIHISVRHSPVGDSETEWDVRTCTSFLKDEGHWMRLCPGMEVPI